MKDWFMLLAGTAVIGALISAITLPEIQARRLKKVFLD
jgi:hypothetical protein